MKKINRIFWLSLCAIILFVGKDIKAQPLCGPTQVGCIIYVYENTANKECPSTTLLSGLQIHFWYTVGGGVVDEFWATSESNGTISHCFPVSEPGWYMQATNPPSGCNYVACTSSFNPSLQICLPYRYGCEPDHKTCYCDNWSCPSGDVIIKNVNEISTNPIKFNLYQNYPNPFNPVTSIKFDLQKESYVKLKIYDLSGKEVRTLIDRVYDAGNYSISFDGSELSSGLYIYKIETPEYSETKKMILMK